MLKQVKTELGFFFFFKLKDFALQSLSSQGQMRHEVLKYLRRSMQSKESGQSSHIWCIHCNRVQQTVCFLWNSFFQTKIPRVATFLNHLTLNKIVSVHPWSQLQPCQFLELRWSRLVSTLQVLRQPVSLKYLRVIFFFWCYFIFVTGEAVGEGWSCFLWSLLSLSLTSLNYVSFWMILLCFPSSFRSVLCSHDSHSSLQNPTNTIL